MIGGCRQSRKKLYFIIEHALQNGSRSWRQMDLAYSNSKQLIISKIDIFTKTEDPGFEEKIVQLPVSKCPHITVSAFSLVTKSKRMKANSCQILEDSENVLYEWRLLLLIELHVQYAKQCRSAFPSRNFSSAQVYPFSKSRKGLRLHLFPSFALVVAYWHKKTLFVTNTLNEVPAAIFV